ncbi:hypothetical protein F4819DRAFT_316364 [Hypoxylon fuscum]|nr:hypothetical protein F4819DRAFT_316364 [Hypoxylon fuscum]
MKCRGTVTLSLLAGLVAGVMAGDLVEDIRRDFDFRMGLFARQQASTDFQRFQGALGGKKAAQIVQNDGTDSDQKPFKTVGGRSDDSFSDFNSAANRVCDDQKNDCADVANNGGGSFSVGQCDDQNSQCKDANQPTEQDDQFLFFCDA